MELPGVSEKDVSVEVHDGVLTIAGEKSEDRSETRDGFFFSERTYGAFKRSFRLPKDVKEEAISASLEKGVLTLNLPRLAEKKPQPRRINIASRD